MPNLSAYSIYNNIKCYILLFVFVWNDNIFTVIEFFIYTFM